MSSGSREIVVVGKYRTQAFLTLGKLCHKCGASKPNNVIHHILPVSHGGTNTLSNLSVLCKGCHSEWHHTVEIDGEDIDNRFERYALWLTVPPTWFMMAFIAKNGFEGTIEKVATEFRKVVEVRRAMLADDLVVDLDYYLEALDEYERNTGSHGVKIGIEQARLRGVKMGRKPMPQERIIAIAECFLAGNGIRQTARDMKVSPMTVQRIRDQLASGKLKLSEA